MALEKRELKLKNGLTKDPEQNFPKCSSNITIIEGWAREFDRDIRSEFSKLERKIDEDCIMSHTHAVEELKELILKQSEPILVQPKSRWDYAREGVATVSNFIGNATTFVLCIGFIMWQAGVFK